MTDLKEMPVTLPQPLVATGLAAEDGIGVGRWFNIYGAFLLASTVALFLALRQETIDWRHLWPGGLVSTLHDLPAWVKLLVLLVSMSICTTYLPLPTGPIVAALATRQAGLTGDVWTTTLLIGLVGALGSTIANLSDYHFFTLLLRSRSVQKIRNTRFYQKAAGWFDSSPFFLLVAFNVLPLPVDVVRLLAITCRYPRRLFAAANFLGRLVRYSFFAFVTYYFDLGWIAPLALLALGAVLVLGKGLHSAYGKLRVA